MTQFEIILLAITLFLAFHLVFIIVMDIIRKGWRSNVKTCPLAKYTIFRFINE